MDVTGWMTNSVTVAPRTGQDSTGAPSYGAQASIPARIVPQQKLIRARDGSEVVSSHVVYAQIQIGILDAIWLPGDNVADPTVAKYPIQTASAYDDNGNPVYFRVTL